MITMPGDKVKARNPTEAITHGVVVPYRGKHDPLNPRVRWHSGWGTSCSNEDLSPVTKEEAETLPVVTLCSIDLK
jgi:hypothetical protein